MAGKPREHAHLDGQLSLDGTPEPTTEPTAEDDANVITGPNTRVRASNAMHRARAGAVRGALDAIARRGIKGFTMVEAADRGGLARATLYNHVRDKEQLLQLVLDHETMQLARAFVEAESLEQALVDAAAAIADHPALAGVRKFDRDALASLSSVTDERVRRLTADALRARGAKSSEPEVDLLLRWLGSFIAVPADSRTRAKQARALARTLR